MIKQIPKLQTSLREEAEEQLKSISEVIDKLKEVQTAGQSEKEAITTAAVSSLMQTKERLADCIDKYGEMECNYIQFSEAAVYFLAYDIASRCQREFHESEEVLNAAETLISIFTPQQSQATRKKMMETSHIQQSIKLYREIRATMIRYQKIKTIKYPNIIKLTDDMITALQKDWGDTQVTQHDEDNQLFFESEYPPEEEVERLSNK